MPSDDARKRLQDAIELYLQGCYASRTAVRAKELSAFLEVARPYLSRKVPDVFGMPLGRYLRQRQLAYAQQLLRTTPLPVEQIAVAAGFGTAGTFYRCFRRAVGMTPKQYRTRPESR